MIPIPRTKTPYLTNLYQFQGYFLATVYTPKFGKAVTLARLDMDDPYVQGVDAQRPEPFQLDRSCFKRSYRRGANLDRLHPKKQANRDARKGERKSKRKGKRKKRKRRAKNSR